jgi:hypothetical protein
MSCMIFSCRLDDHTWHTSCSYKHSPGKVVIVLYLAEALDLGVYRVLLERCVEVRYTDVERYTINYSRKNPYT